MSKAQTLRSFEPRDGERAKPKRYAWREGTVYPYVSLWITVTRFALLNRPRFRSLNEDLQGHEAARVYRSIKFGSALPWPEHGSIDLQFFVRELGEPISAFKWSTVADFPYGWQSLFARHYKICLKCMSQAFHTVLFSASCINRCPLHGDELIAVCPDCDRPLDDRMRSQQGFVPRICGCQREWVSLEHARKPPQDLQRDEALRGVVEWIEHVGSRCWSYAPTGSASHTESDDLTQHVRRWSNELGEALPNWIDIPAAKPRKDPELARCIERSSFSHLSLARLRETGYFEFTDSSPASPGNHGTDARCIFACIRRYIVKHVLGNRVRLVVWLGLNVSADRFRRKLEEDLDARAAWAFLYWMQSSHWAPWEVRTWFLNLLGVSLYGPKTSDPTRHWGHRNQHYVLEGAGNESQAWLANWINASSLMDLWPSQRELAWYSTDQGFIAATVARPSRRAVQWWAWLGEDKHLRFGVYRRRPEWWEPRARSSKADRCAATRKREQELRSLMEQPLLRRHDDGRWLVDDKRTFDADSDLRSARLLLGHGLTLRFCIARIGRGGEGNQDVWFLRCLSLPVGVTAAETKSGLQRLKGAVREYLRRFGGARQAGPA